MALQAAPTGRSWCHCGCGGAPAPGARRRHGGALEAAGKAASIMVLGRNSWRCGEQMQLETRNRWERCGSKVRRQWLSEQVHLPHHGDVDHAHHGHSTLQVKMLPTTRMNQARVHSHPSLPRTEIISHHKTPSTNQHLSLLSMNRVLG